MDELPNIDIWVYSWSKQFLDKAFERVSQENEILRPFKKCINQFWHYRNVVEDHLVVDGFVDGYIKWVFNGEGSSMRKTPRTINDDEGSNLQDHIYGIHYDTSTNVEAEWGHGERVIEVLSEDAKKYF